MSFFYFSNAFLPFLNLDGAQLHNFSRHISLNFSAFQHCKSTNKTTARIHNNPHLRLPIRQIIISQNSFSTQRFSTLFVYFHTVWYIRQTASRTFLDFMCIATQRLPIVEFALRRPQKSSSNRQFDSPSLAASRR